MGPIERTVRTPIAGRVAVGRIAAETPLPSGCMWASHVCEGGCQHRGQGRLHAVELPLDPRRPEEHGDAVFTYGDDNEALDGGCPLVAGEQALVGGGGERCDARLRGLLGARLARLNALEALRELLLHHVADDLRSRDVGAGSGPHFHQAVLVTNEDSAVVVAVDDAIAGCWREHEAVADIHRRPGNGGCRCRRNYRRLGRSERAGTNTVSCPFPRADQMLSEQRNRWAQRGGCRVDATLASCEGESGVLVEAEREAPLDKELLELCGPTRANGPSGGSVPGVLGDGRPGRRAGDAQRR